MITHYINRETGKLVTIAQFKYMKLNHSEISLASCIPIPSPSPTEETMKDSQVKSEAMNEKRYFKIKPMQDEQLKEILEKLEDENEFHFHESEKRDIIFPAMREAYLLGQSEQATKQNAEMIAFSEYLIKNGYCSVHFSSKDIVERFKKQATEK